MSGLGASQKGGAIYLMGGELTVSDTAFHGNTAQVGGAIYTGAVYTIADSRFEGNGATVDGGAISSTPAAP